MFQCDLGYRVYNITAGMLFSVKDSCFRVQDLESKVLGSGHVKPTFCLLLR